MWGIEDYTWKWIQTLVYQLTSCLTLDNVPVHWSGHLKQGWSPSYTGAGAQGCKEAKMRGCENVGQTTREGSIPHLQFSTTINMAMA